MWLRCVDGSRCGWFICCILGSLFLRPFKEQGEFTVIFPALVDCRRVQVTIGFGIINPVTLSRVDHVVMCIALNA